MENSVFTFILIIRYGYALGSEKNELTAQLSVQLLLVLLEYRPAASNDSNSQENARLLFNLIGRLEESSEVKSPSIRRDTNLFIVYISKLHRDSDLEFIMEGIYSLLAHPVKYTRTFLPGSAKPVKFQLELLVLFFVFSELNTVIL